MPSPASPRGRIGEPQARPGQRRGGGRHIFGTDHEIDVKSRRRRTSLNLVAVIAAGVAGNVVGSYLAWAVGRYGWQPALRRWGHRLWLRDHDLDRATSWFARYGPRAVLIGRVLPVVRTFISLPAGIVGMDPAGPWCPWSR